MLDTRPQQDLFARARATPVVLEKGLGDLLVMGIVSDADRKDREGLCSSVATQEMSRHPARSLSGRYIHGVA